MESSGLVWLAVRAGGGVRGEEKETHAGIKQFGMALCECSAGVRGVEKETPAGIK